MACLESFWSCFLKEEEDIKISFHQGVTYFPTHFVVPRHKYVVYSKILPEYGTTCEFELNCNFDQNIEKPDLTVLGFHDSYLFKTSTFTIPSVLDCKG